MQGLGPIEVEEGEEEEVGCLFSPLFGLCTVSLKMLSQFGSEFRQTEGVARVLFSVCVQVRAACPRHATRRNKTGISIYLGDNSSRLRDGQWRATAAVQKTRLKLFLRLL